jgi:hypothetical protein
MIRTHKHTHILYYYSFSFSLSHFHYVPRLLSNHYTLMFFRDISFTMMMMMSSVWLYVCVSVCV